MLSFISGDEGEQLHISPTCKWILFNAISLISYTPSWWLNDRNISKTFLTYENQVCVVYLTTRPDRARPVSCSFVFHHTLLQLWDSHWKYQDLLKKVIMHVYKLYPYVWLQSLCLVFFQTSENVKYISILINKFTNSFNKVCYFSNNKLSI